MGEGGPRQGLHQSHTGARASPATVCGITVTSRRWLRIFTPWSGSCMLTTTRSIWAKGGLEGLFLPASPRPKP